MRDVFLELEKYTYLPFYSLGHGFDGPISSGRYNLSYVSENAGQVEISSNTYRELECIETEGTEQFEELGRRSAARNHIVETSNARKTDGSQKYPLTVSLHSLATRVLLESSGPGSKPKATGAEYMTGEGLYGADKRYDLSQQGVLESVKAKGEVIVAGGAFNTPQVLKLSGVESRDELEALGIPFYVDFPAVGSYHLFNNYEGGISVEAATDWGAVNPTTTRKLQDLKRFRKLRHHRNP
ncbi:hypothetical protein F5B21DRAFT_526871 [Xylaria acuta]|nr:hypothetical protein F5B21DRAFT_526871 [Xylaria acuta]